MIVAAKYDRALKLHLLSWIDFDTIKAGEIVALTTLELALKDRYGDKVERPAWEHLVRSVAALHGRTRRSDGREIADAAALRPRVDRQRLTGEARPP